MYVTTIARNTREYAAYNEGQLIAYIAREKDSGDWIIYGADWATGQRLAEQSRAADVYDAKKWLESRIMQYASP